MKTLEICLCTNSFLRLNLSFAFPFQGNLPQILLSNSQTTRFTLVYIAIVFLIFKLIWLKILGVWLWRSFGKQIWRILWCKIFTEKFIPKFFEICSNKCIRVNFWLSLKGYLHYKTITSQNASFQAKVTIFLFRRKIIFGSQDIQGFVFLTIPWFTKYVTSWWVLVHETWCIFDMVYLLNHNSLIHHMWSIDRYKPAQYFSESFWTIWWTEVKYRALFDLVTCSNYSMRVKREN